MAATREGRGRPEGQARHRSEAGRRHRRSVEPDRRRRSRPTRAQFVVWHELEGGAGGGSDLFRYARELVRGAAERVKPTGVRLPDYADSPPAARREAAARPQARRAGAGAAAAGVLALQDPRAAGRRRAGGGHAARARRAPRRWPSGWSAGSKLADPAVRKALWDGGMTARRRLERSDDPVRAAHRPAVARRPPGLGGGGRSAPIQDGGERDRPGALRASRAPASIPTPTFSLRLSYGKVAGWTDQGQDDGRLHHLRRPLSSAPPARRPTACPAAGPPTRGKLDPATVLDFATTNDITGGSSGSPVVDAKRRDRRHGLRRQHPLASPATSPTTPPLNRTDRRLHRGDQPRRWTRSTATPRWREELSQQ